MTSKIKKEKLWIFHGEDRYTMLETARKLDAHTVEDIEQLPSLMTGGSLFNKGEQTYLVKDNKKILSWEPSKLKQLTKKNRLIIVTDKLDMRSKLAKGVNTLEFPKLAEKALLDVLNKELPELKGKKEAHLLVYLCKNDVSILHNEIHKLKNLRFDVEITEDLLYELITPPLEDAIFDMIDSIATRQAGLAYEIYTDLIQLGESPIKIVSLLYTKFKQMFLVQGYANMDNKTVAAKTGLTFWQVKKAKEAMGRFNEWQLVNAIFKIFKCEVAMKTGELEINLAMEDLLLNLLGE